MKTDCPNCDLEKESLLARELGISSKVVRLLNRRGICDVQSARAFLSPAVDDLTPLERYSGLCDAAKRIERAIVGGETIVIYGDYDCDGVCSVSMLYLYLKSRGAQVQYYIPNRKTEGYGMNTDALEKIAETWLPDLLISVDCGITSAEEVAYAQEALGIEVIVTDHHELSEEIPDCITVNPKLSENGAFRDLCGAGIALRLIEALGGKESSKYYYDLAAIATVADVVPLMGDNRVIVYYGLIAINKGLRKGLDLLVRSCVKGQVSSSDIAFRIAPRLNSLGRVSDANKAVTLFAETDSFLLKCLIDEINQANDLRQQLTADLTEDCMQRLRGYDFVSHAFIVLYHPYWDEGVLGIAAARIVNRFHRPVLLLTKCGDVIKGSGRSVEGINLFECVDRCRELTVKFGGHAMACGLSLQEGDLAAFTQRLDEAFETLYPDYKFDSTAKYDIELDRSEIDLQLIRQFRALQPCGEGNREPLFRLNCARMSFSQIAESDHLKHRERDFELIAFYKRKYQKFLNSDVQKSLYLTFDVNVYQNIEYAQGIVERIASGDMEIGESADSYVRCSVMDVGSTQLEAIDEQTALSWMRSQQRGGVCFISYDESTCRDLLRCGDCVVLDNRYPSGVEPCKRVIYRMERDCDLGYYDRVVFMERPLAGDCVARLNVHDKCRCYYVDNPVMKDLCRTLLPSYEHLGRLFVALKSILSEGNRTDWEKVYLDWAKLTGRRADEIALASAIFSELGIVIRRENVIMIDSEVTNKITNSKIYRTLIEE